MKIIFTNAICILFTIMAMAQAPQAINYQGVLRNASGFPIANHHANFQLSILQGSLTGAAVYVEAQSDSTNQFGLFNLKIGEGSMSFGVPFNNIDWASGPFFLKVDYDTSGNNEFVAMGTMQFVSVPYALHAEKSLHALLSDSAVNSNHSIVADTSSKSLHATFADSAANSHHAISSDNSTNANHALLADSVLHFAIVQATNSHACLDTLPLAGNLVVTDTSINSGGNFYCIKTHFSQAYVNGITNVTVMFKIYKNGALQSFVQGQNLTLYTGITPVNYVATSAVNPGDIFTIEIIAENLGCKNLFVHTRTF